jgi:flagellar motor switch protein FliN/FliY
MSAHEPTELSGPDAKHGSVKPGANAVPPLGPEKSAIDSLEFVMDVPVEVTVEIGRKRMKIAELLRIGTGFILELDKASGEPLDIYVNNRIVARGEAVVVGEHYGVRLTEILFNEDGRSRAPEGR